MTQLVLNGDSLHEMSNPVFWENKKNSVYLSSVELAQRVVKINVTLFWHRWLKIYNVFIQVMDEGVKKLIGEHDYRNLCKMDVANGVTNFTRKILSAEITTMDEKFVYLFFSLVNRFLISSQKHSRSGWLSWMCVRLVMRLRVRPSQSLSWRLIMKYFQWSFSPVCWFRKCNCQFLSKKCAQYWLAS